MHNVKSGQPASPLEDALRALVNGGILAAAVTERGALVETSPGFDDIFGLGAGRTAGLALGALCADDDRERVVAAIESVGASSGAEPGDIAPAGRTALMFNARRSDGSMFEAELLAVPMDGGPQAVLLVTDVTERRRAEKQLSYMAFLDPLTSLPNRALFLDRLRETLTATRADGRVFAVMMCDLDGFKQVNDTLGHDAGDAVLQTVARRLEAAVRESDTVARQGGDEFAVILSRLARQSDAAIVAERMIRAFDEPIDVGGTPCKLGISIGIAACPADGDEMDALIARADAAMYESKRAGKNRFTFAASTGSNASPVHLPFFRWNDTHAVGINVIDAQHHGMITLLNELGDTLKAGRDRDATLVSLRGLVTFTAKHFATEERLMRQHPGWPLEVAHAEEHKRLLDDLTSLTVHVDARSLTLTLRFLQEWLVRHIEGMDKPMSGWLRARGTV